MRARYLILGSVLAAGVLAASVRLAYAMVYFCVPTQCFEEAAWVGATCSNSIVLFPQAVNRVAVSASDKPRADRFISICTASLLSKRKLLLDIPPSSTPVTGCQSNCRQPTSSTLWEN